MKKLLAISFCTALVMGLAACGTSMPSSTSTPDSGSTPPISVLPTPPETGSSVPEQSEPEEQKLPPIPADAAMYRGTVTDVVSAAPPADGSASGTYEITLEQAEGTDFGAPKAKFIFTADTRADFAPEKGQYLEVYYGAAPGQPRDFTVAQNVITAIKYHSAEMVNYNGYVASITPHPDRPNEGWLMMVPEWPNADGTTDVPIIVDGKTADGSSAGSEPAQISDMEITNGIRFNYHKDKTKFYLNFDELKVGDRLNIFQSGAMTLSLPPQSFAIEVRYYAPVAPN